MIAYNTTWLENLAAREELEDALAAGLIGEEEKRQADSLFSVGFYSPNYFIRVGLFILTIVIAAFSLGLLLLVLLTGYEDNFGGLLLFFGILTYAALEFFVRIKHHYRSGVDDALLWISGICVVSGINVMADISPGANALIIFILALFFMLRFADMAMAAIAGVALLAVVFFNYILLGSFAKATVAFLLMLIAAAVYFVVRKMTERPITRYYRYCCIILEIVMLICFYTVSNFFVVQETSNEMFGFADNSGNMPYAWLFWIFTVCTPLIYIFFGIKNKDRILVRTGLLLIAAIVFTIRYYYSVMPTELVMLLGGIILIVLSYALTKYLAQPKNGFTSAEIKTRALQDTMNIEGLVIAETFSGNDAGNNNKFGGGSFGGGGASSDF